MLRELWQRPVLDFQGAHHRIDRAGILPLPETPIPLWCGGNSLPPIRRAAELADGFLFGSTQPLVFERAAMALEMVAEAGRDPATFGLEAVIDFTAGQAAWDKAVSDWEKLGGTHFSIRTITNAAGWMRIQAPNFASVREHLGALETFARQFISF